jgi:hypothetical protein
MNETKVVTEGEAADPMDGKIPEIQALDPFSPANCPSLLALDSLMHEMTFLLAVVVE